MAEHVVVMSTAPSAAEAERIAELLVDRRLAACVQLLPTTSVYRWQGVVERSAEVLLLVKTRSELAAAVREAVLAVHPYEVPEVVEVPMVGGSSAYLAWLDESTAGPR